MDPVQKHYSWGKFCYHDTPVGNVAVSHIVLETFTKD